MMKIYFEDKGQDFLEWELKKIDKKMVEVIYSKPFQNFVWKGKRLFGKEGCVVCSTLIVNEGEYNEQQFPCFTAIIVEKQFYLNDSESIVLIGELK